MVEQRLLLLILVLGVVSAGVVPVAGVATGLNTETTQSDDQCEKPSTEMGPKQFGVQASDSTVQQGDPGELEALVFHGNEYDCPLVAQLSLSVPSGIHISGAQNIQSVGQSRATAPFVIQPGGQKSLILEVYGSETGTHHVDGQVTYYPKGYKNMSSTINTFLTFEVTEPTSPPNGSSQDGLTQAESSTEPPADNSGLVELLRSGLALGIGVVVVLSVAVVRRVSS